MNTKKRDPDLQPLPVWRQRWKRTVAWWKKTTDRRRKAYRTLKIVGLKGLTLAISVLGATLISFGVYQAYAPAGYVVGGFMCWLILWSEERDKGRRE